MPFSPVGPIPTAAVLAVLLAGCSPTSAAPTDTGADAPTVEEPSSEARNRAALTLVRTADEIIGAAVSDIVNMLNPSVIVVGGQLAAVDDVILSAAREVIYRRSLPLATRNLRIVPSGIPDPGVHGLAQLVADALYDPASIDLALASGSAADRGVTAHTASSPPW